MKHLIITTLLSLGLFAPATFAKTGDNTGKFTPEQLTEKVQKELTAMKEPGVALWVKGMVCKSCAIGIRKKISKLDFIDQSRLQKGIEMDTDRMLLYVAVKKDTKVEFPALIKAVKKAGYLPMRNYWLVEGTVHSADISK